jgi:hypothetical protein
MSKKYNNLRSVTGLSCSPVLSEYQYCGQDLAGFEGENNDMILIPPSERSNIIRIWQALAVDAAATTAPFILNTNQTKIINTPNFTYDSPTGLTGTLEAYLFPWTLAAGYSPKGLYFQAQINSFPNSVGMASTADGRPYETTEVKIPFSSRLIHKDIIQYLQNGTWLALKLDTDGKKIHMYGGHVGLIPRPDEVVTMILSGATDTGGQVTFSLERKMDSKALETISLGALSSTGPEAVQDLWAALIATLCMPNVSNIDIEARRFARSGSQDAALKAQIEAELAEKDKKAREELNRAQKKL